MPARGFDIFALQSGRRWHSLYRILSIDGGGIRGLIPALVLAELERITQTPCASLFDLIAGSSTGGILALGLAKGYPATELARLYEREGPAIFGRSAERRLLRLFRLAEGKYPAHGIEHVLDRYFGSTRLSEARTDVLVTGYEIEHRTPFFFRSSRARRDVAYDFLMKDAARATSAAPTYFEPARLPAANPAGYWALIDGGVFANNPAMCAYVDAKLATAEEPACLLSLGTGVVTRPIPYHRARRWGIARWAKPLLDIVFDGVSGTVDYQLNRLLPGRYLRLQTALEPNGQSIDDTSAGNLRALRARAHKLIANRLADLERVARLLAPAARAPGRAA